MVGRDVDHREVGHADEAEDRLEVGDHKVIIGEGGPDRVILAGAMATNIRLPLIRPWKSGTEKVRPARTIWSM